MADEYEGRKPVFGENYGRGYIGFSHVDGSFVCEGIAYFTRWSRLDDIKVSHALIVIDEEACIEARFRGGVRVAPLDQYFNDSKCRILFRKPLGLTPEIADRIIATAQAEVGCKYDTSLLISQMLAGSFAGRLLKRALGDAPDRMLSRLLDSGDEWVCSEIVAYAMDQQPEYHDHCILSDPDETINPQELFKDDKIFKPWHKG